MMRIVNAALLLVIALSLSAGAAQYLNSAAILRLGAGARAAGLGGAFLPLADDDTAAFYNPAGMGWINHVSVSSYLSRQFATLTYGAVGISLPYLGAELMRLDSGWIETDAGGFSYVSQCGVIGVGAAIGPVGLGARFKVYQVESPYTALGWAIDPAVLVVTDYLRVGLMLENAFSQPIKLSTGKLEEWAMGLDLGAALRVRPAENVEWNGVFVAEGLLTPAVRVAAGLEGWVGGLGVRVGLNAGGPSMGLSVRVPRMRIDLSYWESGALGESYGASVTYSF